MPRNKQYVDEIEEIIHPFWLGLIILFTVIILVGTSCIVRRKCRSNLKYFWNWFCCRSEMNDENYVKINKPALSTNPYQWAPTYAPPPSSPPKLYKLVRSMRTISIESNAPNEQTENAIDGTNPSRNNETEYTKTSYPNRNPEAARKLFASLRHPSLDPHSSSIDSTNTEIGEQPKKKVRRDRLKFIRTSPFLQSITYGRD